MAIAIREAARNSIGSQMPAKSLELQHTIRLIRELDAEIADNAAKYLCLWDPTFAAYLAKKRAKGKHYNVALSHAANKLVWLIFALEKSQQPDCAAT